MNLPEILYSGNLIPNPGVSLSLFSFILYFYSMILLAIPTCMIAVSPTGSDKHPTFYMLFTFWIS